MTDALVSRTLRTARHTTHYLETGPADGPLTVLLHGWPSTGLIWRAQMEAFAAEGRRCIAPDLRGYGASSVPDDPAAYTIREVVADMVELHDHVGGEPAIWVGHDWGAAVAGAVTAHEPTRVRGVVLVALAYQPAGHALATVVPQVDRSRYPVAEYPDGQWDYYRCYQTHFARSVADLDADPAASLASIYRAGDPSAMGEVAPSARTTRNGGRFGAAHRAPDVAPDPDLWPPADFARLVAAFEVHGFRGPSSWYVNDDAALAYAAEAPHGGRLAQPVLFVNGDFDPICSIDGDRQGDAMRGACERLTVTGLPSGHWLPVERKAELARAILGWAADEEL